MSSIINSTTTSELIELLRRPDTNLTPADRQALADRLVEMTTAQTFPTTKASRRRKSRTERFSEAQSLASDARSTVEELRDELQNWVDNMPENLQSSAKADELNDAISELEDVISGLEDVEGRDITFPGMF